MSSTSTCSSSTSSSLVSPQKGSTFVHHFIIVVAVHAETGPRAAVLLVTGKLQPSCTPGWELNVATHLTGVSLSGLRAVIFALQGSCDAAGLHRLILAMSNQQRAMADHS
jgi:hypothetical protein